MKIILDTNVLLVSISERSKEHWIFEYFLNEEYELCVTTEILTEYEEILSTHLGVIFAQKAIIFKLNHYDTAKTRALYPN